MVDGRCPKKTFRRNVLLPSSGLKRRQVRNDLEIRGDHTLFGVGLKPKDVGNNYLRNEGGVLPDYTAL
jgi:hypothetical protein